MKGNDRLEDYAPGGQEWTDSQCANWFLKEELRKKHVRVDRRSRNGYRKYLDQHQANSKTAPPSVFILGHLEAALQEMDAKKVGGPDKVEIMFLHNLHMTGKMRLLSLVNRSYAK